MKKIGVFDSGIGGLTVLESLVNHFPNEEYLYVADTLNCPYGTRSSEEIEDLVLAIGLRIIKQGVGVLILACNTATSNSSKLVNASPIPIIGVIKPTASFAYKKSINKKILVLATNATVLSGQYENSLKELGEGEFVFVQASDFVPLVEKGLYSSDISYKIVCEKLNEYKSIDFDTIILGCTHFNFLAEEIHSVFPKAKLITCAEAIVEDLNKMLNRSKSSNKPKKILLTTTGDIRSFVKQIDFLKIKYDCVCNFGEKKL